jgi:hypothetical protein
MAPGSAVLVEEPPSDELGDVSEVEGEIVVVVGGGVGRTLDDELELPSVTGLDVVVVLNNGGSRPSPGGSVPSGPISEGTKTPSPTMAVGGSSVSGVVVVSSVIPMLEGT